MANYFLAASVNVSLLLAERYSITFGRSVFRSGGYSRYYSPVKSSATARTDNIYQSSIRRFGVDDRIYA